MVRDRADKPGRVNATRRQFLLGGAVAGVGAAAAIGADYVINRTPAAQDASTTALNGAVVVPFYGTHQAGIDTPAQASAVLLGLDLHDDVDRDGLRRMMRLLTDDAARLTQGVPALADSEPELATVPARLTVTFGFGPGFVARANGRAPAWLKPLPAFSIDQLQDECSHGDLLVQIAGDDAFTVAHAHRMLLKDLRAFASLRWTQPGFRRAYGSEQPGTTMRNLFGQVDGSTNPQPGTDDFDNLVWIQDGWLTGGTSMVIRRTAMNLDKWDRLDRSGRELSVGRTLANGAPLTGTLEHDEPDFAAVSPIGFPIIPEFSHIRRARTDNTGERIFRRGYNYDAVPSAEDTTNSGLIFVSFQADVDRQFVPIQERLAALDLLNEWTIPIGSAVFAVPPGCQEGGYIGESLLA